MIFQKYDAGFAKKKVFIESCLDYCHLSWQDTYIVLIWMPVLRKRRYLSKFEWCRFCKKKVFIENCLDYWHLTWRDTYIKYLFECRFGKKEGIYRSSNDAGFVKRRYLLFIESSLDDGHFFSFFSFLYTSSTKQREI